MAKIDINSLLPNIDVQGMDNTEAIRQLAENQTKLLDSFDYFQNHFEPENFSLDFDQLVVDTINGSDGKLTINADKIDITGAVNFLTAEDLGENGTTVISGERISTGKITAIDIEGVNISGCDIDGGTFETIGSASKCIIEEGEIKLYDKNNPTTKYANFRYDSSDGRFWLRSNDILKIQSKNDMSIATETDGKKIYGVCQVQDSAGNQASSELGLYLDGTNHRIYFRQGGYCRYCSIY